MYGNVSVLDDVDAEMYMQHESNMFDPSVSHGGRHSKTQETSRSRSWLQSFKRRYVRWKFVWWRKLGEMMMR